MDTTSTRIKSQTLFSLLLTIGLLCGQLFFSCNTALAVTQFFIAGEADFVEQVYSGANYTLDNTATVLNPPVGNSRYINPSHKLSGEITLGFLLHRKSDVRLSFLFHNHSASDSLSDSDDTGLSLSLVPAVLVLGGDRASFASSVFSFNINSVDLTIGHTITTHWPMDIRPYLGVDVSRVNIEQNTFYDIIVEEGSASATVDEKSSITGVGPLIGTELSYTVFPQVSLVGDLSIAMLMGRARFSLASQVVGLEVDEPADTKSRVIHAFEKFNTKLGVRYRKYLTNVSRVELMAGYRITKYLGATHTTVLPDDAQSALIAHTQESPGFYGPFLSFTLVSN